MGDANSPHFFSAILNILTALPSDRGIEPGSMMLKGMVIPRACLRYFEALREIVWTSSDVESGVLSQARLIRCTPRSFQDVIW